MCVGVGVGLGLGDGGVDPVHYGRAVSIPEFRVALPRHDSVKRRVKSAEHVIAGLGIAGLDAADMPRRASGFASERALRDCELAPKQSMICSCHSIAPVFQGPKRGDRLGLSTRRSHWKEADANPEAV